MRPHTSTASAEPGAFRHSFLGTFRFSRRAIDLVWSTSRPLTFGLVLLTLIAGVLPAVIAFVGA